MTGPKLDACVVAFDSRNDITACIGSLQGVLGLAHVIVIDHGDDGTAEMAASLGATVVHDSSNPGFGAGHNRGVALSSLPFVALVNPDARVIAGALEVGLALLEERTDVAAVQGVIIDEMSGEPERSHGVALGPVHLWGRALHLRGLLRWAPVRALARRLDRLTDHVARIPDGAVATEALAATVLLIRREAFDQVGGFDERYFLYGEDMDLSRRLGDAGWTLLALPIPWAAHRAGSSHRSSWDREVEWWRGSMRFAATWYPVRDWIAALGAAAIRAATLTVRRPSGAAAVFRAMLVEPRRIRKERS